MEAGLKRVDWLGSKTHLVGVEVDKSGKVDENLNMGKLVFGRPSSSGGGGGGTKAALTPASASAPAPEPASASTPAPVPAPAKSAARP